MSPTSWSTVPERAWQPAISADGTELREHAEVVEITDLRRPVRLAARDVG